MSAKSFQLRNDYLGVDFYTVLGLKKGPASTRTDIIKAFRRIQNETHTDRLVGNAQIAGNQIDPLITEVFHRLRDEAQYAYDILRDDSTRQYYDTNRRTFDDQMAKRRHDKGDEVRQIALDTKEALSRADLLFKATEAQAPRRKAAEDKLKSIINQRDMLIANRKRLQDQVPYIGPEGEKEQKLASFDAQLEELAQQISDSTTEITECDRPIKELNDQFRADTEAKRAKEDERRNEEHIRSNEMLIEQWEEQLRIAQEGLAGKRAAPPGEDGRRYWEHQFYSAQEALDNLRSEQRKRSEKESGAPSDEGKAAGGEKAAPGEDTGAEEEAAPPPGGEHKTSHGFKTDSGKTGGTENDSTPGGQSFWDKRRTKAEDNSRRKTQDKARKQREKEEADEKRAREKAEQEFQNEQAKQARRDEKEQEAQARQAEREARDAQRTQAERDRQDTEQSSVIEEEGERVAAAARRAARAEGAVPPTEEETTGPAGEEGKVGATVGGGGEAKG